MANIRHWRHAVKAELLGGKLAGQILSPHRIEACCQRAGHLWRRSFWSPSRTILTFLLQVLVPVKTLRAAVSELLTQLAASGMRRLPSADPAAYCQARRRLPVSVVKDLVSRTARCLTDLVGADAGWRGRRVWIVDASCCSTPDVPQLQRAFPQSPNQKSGCGFPLVRYVGLFCWRTGALVALKVGNMITSELLLYRQLWHHLKRGDVVIGDRLYGSYVDLARLRRRGVDGIYRLHKGRKATSKGKRLGPGDRLVVWRRPPRWLPSMGISRKAFDQLPKQMTLRQIRVTSAPRGFRSRKIVVVTTLLDPIEAPADEIRQLYRDRWMIELNFRNIKTALGMDVLRGKSVDVIHKELFMHLVVYNLIRLLMWQAAKRHGVDLHRLSFAGTLHRLEAAASMLLLLDQLKGGRTLYDWLLAWIAADEVPLRPNRREPRCVKRRPKDYPWLTMPRHAVYHQS